MPDIDVFNFFRWGLSIVVSVYCVIVTAQSCYGWYIWLMTEDRYMSIVRQYVVLHGLRLRFRTFWGDVLVCVLLCVVFLLLFHAHQVILSIDPTYR